MKRIGKADGSGDKTDGRGGGFEQLFGTVQTVAFEKLHGCEVGLFAEKMRKTGRAETGREGELVNGERIGHVVAQVNDGAVDAVVELMGIRSGIALAGEDKGLLESGHREQGCIGNGGDGKLMGVEEMPTDSGANVARGKRDVADAGGDLRPIEPGKPVRPGLKMGPEDAPVRGAGSETVIVRRTTMKHHKVVRSSNEFTFGQRDSP